MRERQTKRQVVSKMKMVKVEKKITMVHENRTLEPFLARFENEII
jgi:hypothetical protein